MANKKLSQEEMVVTVKHPEWLDSSAKYQYCDDDFYKIILFFVIFSPCPKYCTQGQTLQSYGWKEKPWATNRYLKNKLDDGVFSDKKKYFRCVSKIPQLVEAVHKANLEDDFYLNRDIERVAFVNTGGSGYMGLFHHIRCALAHGRIAMFEEPDSGDITLVMENGHENGNVFQVKARMVLRRNTLLKWIKIITDGPQEKERDYCLEVYKVLQGDNKLRKKDLIEKLREKFDETEYVIKKAIETLEKEKIITYQNHGKNRWWDVNAYKAQAYFDDISE